VKFRSGALPAVFVLNLMLVTAPARAQAQDQEARSAIAIMKAEISKLKSEIAVLRAQMSQQGRMLVQTPTGLQIGNADIETLTIRSKRGSIIFDRDNLTINGRNTVMSNDHFDVGSSDSVTIKSDVISLNARIVDSKTSGNAVLRAFSDHSGS